MNSRNGYSLQRTMIIYMLLIGVAALLVASEFVVNTYSTELREELSRNFDFLLTLIGIHLIYNTY